MEPSLRQQILALVRREVVPAIGCTEPMAVALCVARATETLGRRPESITTRLSANILKNAMGVGIPGTGMIGLPIAIALGALIGRSDYELEVLKDCTPQAVDEGKQFIDEKRIRITLKEDIDEKLYIEATCRAGHDEATAIISGGHTRFQRIERNGQVLLDRSASADAQAETDAPALTLRTVYDFAQTAPLDEISFILQTARLNKAAAEASFRADYGHGLGKMLRGRYENEIMGDSVFSHILSYTSGACDARMAGAMIPVMSNSGSGNQGISATLPVLVFAEETGKTEEQLIRALMLSHLTVIYIKQSLGRLSALCGCVVAATGSSCGITYLMGGDYQPHRHDMRRRQTQLRPEGHHRRIHRRPLRHHGHGRPHRHLRRRHHRPRRRPKHPQPHPHRLARHERNRPPRARHHDPQDRKRLNEELKMKNEE